MQPDDYAQGFKDGFDSAMYFIMKPQFDSNPLHHLVINEDGSLEEVSHHDDAHCTCEEKEFTFEGWEL